MEETTSGNECFADIHDDNDIDTSQQEDLLYEKLKLLDCPFNWAELNSADIDVDRKHISELKIKCEEIACDDSSFWHKFILYLILCYEHDRRNDLLEAVTSVEKIDELLGAVTNDETSWEIFECAKYACHHVVWSCKTFLHYKMNQYEEARNSLKVVIPFSLMNNVNKAALYGIRAAVLMEYGLTGKAKAVLHAETATLLHPEQAKWHFLYAFCRMRTRHQHRVPPDDREINAFLTAIELSNCSTSKACLAFSYLDQRLDTPLCGTRRGILDAYRNKAKYLMLEASQKQQTSIYVNLECARGFSLLPRKFQCLEHAIDCCHRVLATQPNNREAYYQLGFIYEEKMHDYEKAKEHYTLALKARCYKAFRRLCSLKYWLDENYDPISDEDVEFTKTCEIQHYQNEAVCQTGSFFLFVKNDIQESFRHFSTLFTEKRATNMLKNHVCTFLKTNWMMNVFHVLYDEAYLASRDCQDEAMRDFYSHVVNTCASHDPAAGRGPPVSYRKRVWTTAFVSRLNFSERDKRMALQKFLE